MILTAESARFLREFVKQRAAIVIEPTKDYLLDARLGPIVQEHGLGSFDALVQRLQATTSSALHTQVVEALTTNETSFFRDVHPFNTLREHILPALIAARGSARTLRIWCAAASTGQEPYSLAMLIREHFRELDSWNVTILATDINETVLDRARSGLYRQLEVNRGLPASFLVKYFDRVGADFQVKADVRAMVKFQQLNLLSRWPLFAPQDLVMMRNVLIYFDFATKKSILERVSDNLRPDGFLMLGGAETTLHMDERLELSRHGMTLCYRPRGSRAEGDGTTKPWRTADAAR